MSVSVCVSGHACSAGASMGRTEVWGCQPEATQWPRLCTCGACFGAAHAGGGPTAGSTGWHVPKGTPCCANDLSGLKPNFRQCLEMHLLFIKCSQKREEYAHMQVQEAIVHSQAVFLRQVQLKERALATRVLHAWRDIRYELDILKHLQWITLELYTNYPLLC